ncbi:TonB-dependent receptor [Qipengyuania sp. 6B39]|uniref:TonB-dependent receptor n=1 Tax=Qipengyuania proteolytica TaxID=2867239 RepID=UPI001C8957D9|nr:TonB-dependent receptor [Qipengyuania proteolytica]MBX7496815.1 TonB-dependent receptor [Qipengyuania proteolytica]
MKTRTTGHIARAALLSSSMIATAYAAPALAQDADTASASQATDENVIIVTATRREESVQDVPFNISAVTAEDLVEQGAFNLREASRLVPGVFFVDNGARNNSLVVFRGLSADPLGSNDGGGNGGTVGTYLGEVPLLVDLRLKDVQRVEFLIGPQGTLYGSGTLGGAIRYIPNKADLDSFSGSVRADLYTIKDGDGISHDTGATLNVPIVPGKLAFRGSLDYLDDKGFIDYPYAVANVGVSNPDGFGDASNFNGLKDVNDEQTLTARAVLRAAPTDWFDVELAYTLQDQETGGRQLSNRAITTLPVELGKYESAMRVPEPNDRKTQLFSVEATADLGFAQLTSATGWATEDETGQRDQTDLLIALEYSYEAFPNFTSFTLEDSDIRAFTQEVRLVSQHGGPFQWIVGGFYQNFRFSGFSKEFTPGFDQFAVDEFGGIQLRPDSLEYFSVDEQKLEELGFYGELTFDITDRWSVTGGIRYYDYDFQASSAVDIPLFRTVFDGDDPDSIVLDFQDVGQQDDGFLFKLNTSFDVTDDVLVYATYSEGFRIGSANGVALCPNPLPNTQIVCALPNEFQYFPDTTNNYELGFKSQLADRTITLNGALYYIKWNGPQVSSATVNGSQPITVNGAGAESKGFELAASWEPIRGLQFSGSYAYTDPTFTKDAIDLIAYFVPPGFSAPLDPSGNEDRLDGKAGDRLPGSPKHKGSFFAKYETPVTDTIDLGLSYGFTAQSNVLRTAGNRGNGYKIPGFSIHNVAVSAKSDSWSLTLYADNVFNKYAVGGVRGNPDYNQVLADINGDPVYQRTFGEFVLAPRTIGLRMTYDFGG